MSTSHAPRPPAPPKDGFQLPLRGLYADLDVGEGSLNFADDFLSAPGTVQLEVIRDWRIALEEQHQRALVHLYHEVTGKLQGAATPEKLRRFRAHCQQLGIECPADMAILLQRY